MGIKMDGKTRLSIEVDFDPADKKGNEIPIDEYMQAFAKNLAYFLCYRMIHGFSLDIPMPYTVKFPEGTHPDDRVNLLMKNICVHVNCDDGHSTVSYMGANDKNLEIKFPELIGKEENRDGTLSRFNGTCLGGNKKKGR